MQVFALLGPDPEQGVATRTVGFAATDGTTVHLELLDHAELGAWPQLWSQCRELAGTGAPSPSDLTAMLDRANGITAGSTVVEQDPPPGRSPMWVVQDLIDQQLEAGY